MRLHDLWGHFQFSESLKTQLCAGWLSVAPVPLPGLATMMTMLGTGNITELKHAVLCCQCFTWVTSIIQTGKDSFFNSFQLTHHFCTFLWGTAWSFDPCVQCMMIKSRQLITSICSLTTSRAEKPYTLLVILKYTINCYTSHSTVLQNTRTILSSYILVPVIHPFSIPSSLSISDGDHCSSLCIYEINF